jgi:hypothetical protein
MYFKVEGCVSLWRVEGAEEWRVYGGRIMKGKVNGRGTTWE